MVTLSEAYFPGDDISIDGTHWCVLSSRVEGDTQSIVAVDAYDNQRVFDGQSVDLAAIRHRCSSMDGKMALSAIRNTTMFGWGLRPIAADRTGLVMMSELKQRLILLRLNANDYYRVSLIGSDCPTGFSVSSLAGVAMLNDVGVDYLDERVVDLLERPSESWLLPKGRWGDGVSSLAMSP